MTGPVVDTAKGPAMAQAPGELSLRIADMGAEARDVLRLELVDPRGGDLPVFEPGAHLDVHLPNGLVRQYSLANDARERHRYVIGVGRAAPGRGGSACVHTELRPGMALRCGAPVNHFPLVPDAPRYLFIAGGIGITPILSMVRWCEAAGRPWRLVYAARNRSRLAFYEDLAPFGGKVQWHCDDEAGGPLPAARLVAEAGAGTHIYCCGPAPLMEAVRDAPGAVPAAARHFEWFAAPQRSEPDAAAGGFWVELRRSQRRFHVPPERSILEVLEANGLSIPFSCREGLCGTCETAVCEGEPEHRDYVYPESERPGLRRLLVCVSRSRTPGLVLDL